MTAIVPCSRPVNKAERLGLDKIFMDAGFEWRDPGCSTCLGMNPDHVPEGALCIYASATVTSRDVLGDMVLVLTFVAQQTAAAAITGRCARYASSHKEKIMENLPSIQGTSTLMNDNIDT